MKKLNYSILFLFVLMFYVMNTIIPFFGDDYAVIYSSYDNELITSLSDLLKSAIYSWQGANGRFFCNMFMSAFPSIIQETMFNVLNTVVLALTLWLFLKVIASDFKVNSIAVIFVVLSGIYVIMLEDGSLFFWGAGAANYLWPMAMSLAFLAILQYVKNVDKPLGLGKDIVLMISSFLLGLQHEMFVIPMSFSLFVYYAFNRKLLSRSLLFVLVGFFMATLVVFASPGNFNRMGREAGMEELNVMAVVRRTVSLFKSLKFFYLLFVAWGILWFRCKKKAIFFFHDNVLLLMMIFSSFVIPVVAGQGGRAATAIEMFSIIGLARLVYGLEILNAGKWIYGLVALLFIHFSLVLHDSYYKWNIIDSCSQAYLHGDKDENLFVRDTYEGMAITKSLTVDVDERLNTSWQGSRLARIKRDRLSVDSVCPFITIPKDVADMLYKGSPLFDKVNRVPGNAGFYSMESVSYYVMPYDSLKAEQIKQGLLYKTQALPLVSGRGLEINIDPSSVLVSPCPILFVKDEKIGDWIMLDKTFKTYWGMVCDTISIHTTAPSSRFRFIRKE